MDILASDAQPVEHRESGLKDIKLIRGLWPYLRRHKRALLISCAMLPFIALMEMGMTFLIRFSIDGPIKNHDWSGLCLYAGSFFILLILNFRLRYLQMDISQKTGQHIIHDLRVELYRHYQSLSPRFYHKHPQGKLLTRLTSDIESLNEMLASGGLAILADLAMVVGAFAGMLIMNWSLACVAVGTMVVLLMLMDIFRKRSRLAYDEIRVHAARMNAFLQESLNGMELVQLYRREQVSAKHFAKLNDRNMRSGLNSIFYSTTFNALVDFMTVITLILILGVGSLQAQHGGLTIGKLVGFFLFVRKMFEPVEDISEKYSVLQSGLASVDKVMALFRETPEILSPAVPANLPGRAAGDIIFDHVSFGYNPGEPILRELNIAIQPGQTVAIVGPSGAGKTTFLKLLMRFYDVSHGRVTVDGVDVRQWDLHHLRRNIVSIQQDDFLFSRSIAENITLQAFEPQVGVEGTSILDAMDPGVRERLEMALDQSHARQVLDRFPDGLAQVIQSGGQNLSAGERQLLLFARAIYHDPAILILDEATSAVDPINEHRIQEAMVDMMQHRTVLIVAHRLSTVRQADRILVFEHGRLVQDGNHTALINQPGLYQQLCDYQDQLHSAIPG